MKFLKKIFNHVIEFFSELMHLEENVDNMGFDEDEEGGCE